MKKKFILFFIMLTGIIVLGGAWVYIDFIESPFANPGGEVIFETTPGESFHAVAKRLQNEHLISNPFLFYVYARVNGLTTHVKVGQYLLKTPVTPAQVLAALVSGLSIAKPVTIPEGYNIFDIAEAIADATSFTKKDFMSRVLNAGYVDRVLKKYLPLSFKFETGNSPPTLEGYLYPDTYLVTKYTSIDELIGRMVQRFAEEYKKIQATVKPTYPLTLSDDRVVTFASIVEKETAAVDERPHIAGVFFNRLQKDMLLQTDPTVLYAKMRRTRQFENNITRVDLHADDPYNTYVRRGLPPGPIASPGHAAIVAVLQPVKTSSLYFVSRNDGTHVFSDTLSDHDTAVKKYQIDFFKQKKMNK